jgi:methyltransferase (TIGR00027 family)
LEVDHPATQRWKRRRLAEAGIAVPHNVSFVPVDFEKASLAAVLPEVGLDFAARTFFSLLGVTQYLSEAALNQTLRFVLSAPAGSEIVFSFVTLDEILPADDAAVVRELVARNAAIGEPWLSRFLREELIAKLTTMGFSTVFHLSPENDMPIAWPKPSWGKWNLRPMGTPLPGGLARYAMASLITQRSRQNSMNRGQELSMPVGWNARLG